MCAIPCNDIIACLTFTYMCAIPCNDIIACLNFTYMCEVNDDPGILPLDDEVCVDLDGKVSIVNFQNLEIVKPDRNVHRISTRTLQRGHVSEK